MLKRLTKLPPSIAAEIGADLLHAQPERRDLVAIDTISACGWSILMSMIGGNAEHAPLCGRFLLERLGELEDSLRLGGRGDDELDREQAAAGKRGRQDGEHSMPGNRISFFVQPPAGSGTLCACARPTASTPCRRSRKSGT